MIPREKEERPKRQISAQACLKACDLVILIALCLKEAALSLALAGAGGNTGQNIRKLK